MALPFIAGLVIGSGVALLFTKKDAVQKGVDFAKNLTKITQKNLTKPAQKAAKTQKDSAKNTPKRRTRKPRAKKNIETNTEA